MWKSQHPGKGTMHKFKWHLLCEASLDVITLPLWSLSILLLCLLWHSTCHYRWVVFTCLHPQSGCSKWLIVSCSCLHPSGLLAQCLDSRQAKHGELNWECYRHLTVTKMGKTGKKKKLFPGNRHHSHCNQVWILCKYYA